MGKIVKAVIGVGLIVAGAVTGNIALISAGVSLGVSALASSPKQPKNSAENVNRLRANIDPLTPRKTAVGITALATDIRDEEFTDNQAYFHRFIVCASHKVESIDEIWFDDKRVWTVAGGVEGEAVGYLQVTPILEGSAGNAINISARMGSTRRYTGLAYVHLRYKLTGNNKNTDSPYAQSITTRITIRGKGAALPDPRDVAQDMADQSTWGWDVDACRNPALALLFYLLGYRINGKLAIGKGIPPDRIDLDSFITAANLCDEPVAKVGGGTEPRYRVDGIWSEGDAPTSVIDMLKASMNGDLDDVGGKLRLTVFHDDLATPDAEFTDNDIIDGFTWQPFAPLDESFNVVRGLYTDPSDESLYQQVDYPEQRETSPDGIDRIFTLNLPMVESAGQAQRLAALRLARQAYSGVFSAEFQATAWKVTKNSVIKQTFKQTGFVDRLFRVAAIEIRQDGVVPMTLREENAAIYGAPAVVAPVEPVASTPYDYTKNPFVIGASGARVFRSKTIAFPLSSNDTSVTIAAFDGVLDDGRTLSLTSATISSLTSGETYIVFYNILTGAYVVEPSPATTEFANPDLAYIGTQQTSTGGTYDDPEPPPPGYCVADDTPILLADGTEVPASDLTVGTLLSTQDEHTLAWGVYAVAAVSFHDDEVYACQFGATTIRATAQHRFLIDRRWILASDIGVPDGMARVAKITVTEAHTYVSAGILSHNVKAIP